MADRQDQFRPCPICSGRNDFENHKEMLVDQWTGKGANDRPWFACDHCGQLIEVVKVEPTTLISVRRKQ